MLRPAYPLETDRLLLRPYVDDDLDALHDIERREETARYLYNPPLELDATRALLERRKALTTIDDDHDREAHLRENEFVKGEWCDELVYAILAGEWRTQRRG